MIFISKVNSNWPTYNWAHHLPSPWLPWLPWLPWPSIRKIMRYDPVWIFGDPVGMLYLTLGFKYIHGLFLCKSKILPNTHCVNDTANKKSKFQTQSSISSWNLKWNSNDQEAPKGSYENHLDLDQHDHLQIASSSPPCSKLFTVMRHFDIRTILGQILQFRTITISIQGTETYK